MFGLTKNINGANNVKYNKRTLIEKNDYFWINVAINVQSKRALRVFCNFLTIFGPTS